MKKQMSQKVRERLEDSVILAESLASNIDELIEEFEARFDAGFAQRRKDTHLSLVRATNKVADALEADEQQVNLELQDDEGPRDARDKGAETLYEALQQVKPSFVSIFGPQSLSTYGLDGIVPRKPADLATFAANAIRLMEAQPARSQNLLNMVADTAAAVALLAPLYQNLRDALAQVKGEEADLDNAYNRRDLAIENFDRIAEYARDTACADYILCGRSDLAIRLRSRLRGPQSTTMSDAAAGDPDAQPTADTPAGDPTPAMGDQSLV